MTQASPTGGTFVATLLNSRITQVQDLPDLADAADQLIPLELQFHPREEDPLATFQQEQMELQSRIRSGQGQPAVRRRIASAGEE